MKLINFIIFLVFTSVCYSQIPIKVGIAYYKIEKKIPNESMLSNYYDRGTGEYLHKPNPRQSFSEYERERKQERFKSVGVIAGNRKDFVQYDFDWRLNGPAGGKTKTGKEYFAGRVELKLPISYKTDFGLGDKKRVNKLRFNFEPQYIFENDETMVVKIKGINVWVTGLQGVIKPFEVMMPLGELYKSFMENAPDSEKAKLLFEDLDRTIREHIQLYFESFERSVEVYDLD